MQPNKTKLALIMGTLLVGASSASYSATGPQPITVQTLPDVQIFMVQDLDFGSSMFIDASQSCVMSATTPDPVALRFNNGAATNTAYGDLAGTGCVDGSNSGLPGIYRVEGLEGQSVSIKISSVTEANGAFSFNPNQGCIVTYDGADTGGGDQCQGFVPNAFSSSKPLAVTADGSANGVVAGQLMFTVGGTITIGGTDLSPGTPYNARFPVEVVYQ